MSTHIHSESPANQFADAAKEITRRDSEAAQESAKRATAITKDVTDVVEDVAGGATDTAKDMYQSTALKVGDTLETSREYVRRNPLPVVLATIAFGAAIGYMLMMARRKPTFSERYADEPLTAVREAILGALAPVAQRAHEGYDWARDGAGKAMDRVHNFGSGRNGDLLSHKIGRIGNNLKFW